ARVIVEQQEPDLCSQVGELRRTTPLVEGIANSVDGSLPVCLGDSMVDTIQDGLYLFLCASVGAFRSVAMNVGYGTSKTESSGPIGPIQLVQGPTGLRDRVSALLDDFVKAQRGDKFPRLACVFAILHVSNVVRT